MNVKRKHRKHNDSESSMSEKPIQTKVTFANLTTEDSASAISLSDCPDDTTCNTTARHSKFLMSSASDSDCMRLSDVERIINANSISEQISDSNLEQHHVKRRRIKKIHSNSSMSDRDIDDNNDSKHDDKNNIEQTIVEQPKRKRGRPKKANPTAQSSDIESRKRGRPKKIKSDNISLTSMLPESFVDSDKPIKPRKPRTPKPKIITRYLDEPEQYKLTFEEFRYHPIKHGEENNLLQYPPEQLVIKLLPKDYVYECLTPYKYKLYKHDCPFIHNPAPTLDQYYQMFKIYTQNMLYDKSKESPMPKDSFFDEVNQNFFTSRIIHKQRKNPNYWYHYNKDSKQHEQWSMIQAQQHYCKLYQESIFDDYESKTTFSIIHSYAMNRDKSYPIIICGYNVCDSNNLKKPLDPTQMYKKHGCNYSFEYAFVEMLVNYPVLSMCSWSTI